MGIEQRTHARVSTANLVSFRQWTEDFTQLLNLGLGATIDISPGGIKLWCTEPLPVPCTLTLSLALGEEIVEVLGRVVHVEESDQDQRYVVRIAFVDPSDIAREKIQAFLDEKLM